MVQALLKTVSAESKVPASASWPFQSQSAGQSVLRITVKHCDVGLFQNDDDTGIATNNQRQADRYLPALLGLGSLNHSSLFTLHALLAQAQLLFEIFHLTVGLCQLQTRQKISMLE